jgi:hypothetical protein
MHPKIKDRPKGNNIPGNIVEPLLPHEAVKQSASFIKGSRLNSGAIKLAPFAANHARHHVSRKTQSSGS